MGPILLHELGAQCPCPCPEQVQAPGAQWHAPPWAGASLLPEASVWHAMPSDSDDGTLRVGLRPKKPYGFSVNFA